MSGLVTFIVPCLRPMLMMYLLIVVTNSRKISRTADGEFEKDSLGRVKREFVTDEESKKRRNYQKGNVINYLDGDSLIIGVSYDSTEWPWLWYHYPDQR